MFVAHEQLINGHKLEPYVRYTLANFHFSAILVIIKEQICFFSYFGLYFLFQKENRGKESLCGISLWKTGFMDQMSLRFQLIQTTKTSSHL